MVQTSSDPLGIWLIRYSGRQITNNTWYEAINIRVTQSTLLNLEGEDFTSDIFFYNWWYWNRTGRYNRIT